MARTQAEWDAWKEAASFAYWCRSGEPLWLQFLAYRARRQRHDGAAARQAFTLAQSWS